MRTWILALLAAVVVAPIAGCGKKSPPQSTANSTDPQWVKRHDPHAKVALVFVHGLFGDTLGTWTADDGTTFFDLIAAEPEVGPKVDMFAFGFTSNMLRSGSFSVGDAANRLSERLQYHKVLDYPAIVFVAHSMGGLVVLQALTTHRELVERVPLIVFYATPQEGAQITRIATKLTDNPGIVNMFPADKNLYLQGLNDAWRKIVEKDPHPRIRCAFEKRPTYGEMIVPWATATRFCDGTAAAIDANHFNTVKPDRAGHDSLVLLVNALNETVLGKDLIGQLEIPDFKPEGDHRVFTIADPEADSVARMKNVGRRELQYSFERSDPKLVIDPERAAIEPRAERSVALFLKFGADKPEYNVVLHTDFGPLADARVEQTKVLVRVRDLTAARAGQLQLAAGVVEDMSNFLSKPEQNRLQRLPANDPEAPIEIATVAHNSVAERAELPQTASWLLTADLFNAANWPTLSVQALRKAEESSATVANSVSVQRLAAVAAANSGERRIFRAADTSPQPTVELSSVHPFVNPAVARASSKLASQLQAIPAVAAQGLTLEGDLKRLQGDTAGARDLYRRVEQLQRSPMITQLLSSVTANATPPQRDRSDPLTLVARRDLKLPQLANTSVAKELQMQNIGRTRLQLSAALVLPRTDKSALRVVADKCAGSTLEPKQTCSLWVECVGDPSATRNVAVVVTSPATAGKEMDWEAVCGQLDLIYSQGRPEDAELARNPNLDRLEVRNIGKAKLAIGAVQVSNPRSFSVASDQCSQTTLAPQESCSIVIDCLEMDREAHISIPNSGDAGPLKIQWQRVCGRPKAPIIVVG